MQIVSKTSKVKGSRSIIGEFFLIFFHFPALRLNFQLRNDQFVLLSGHDAQDFEEIAGPGLVLFFLYVVAGRVVA